MVRRKIVRINEDLCTGCGKCVVPCAEGAIALVNGKARIMSEELCDGLGYCIGLCPAGALSLEERDAREFDEGKAEAHLKRRRAKEIVAKCFKCGRSEEEVAVFPVRIQGKSEWVCAKCIPPLIHG